MKLITILILVIIVTGCNKSLFDDKINNDPEFIFDAFWNELDRNYSFFQYTKLNWDSIYIVYRPLVNKNTPETDLFQTFTRITDLLKDAHTNIFTPKGVTGNIHYFDNFKINQIDLMFPYFSNYVSLNKIFDYGLLKSSDIGYIRIKTFEGENESFSEIDTILNELQGTKGIILDVRSNRGGLIANCEIIVSRFVDTARNVCKYRLRNGPQHSDFSEWIDYNIFPTIKGTKYKKPIVVLTNRFSYSATEWFVLSANALPNVTILGDTTGGGSAIPLIRELPNGWLVRMSNTQTLLPSGRDFQGTGLFPDIPLWISTTDAKNNRDTILEKAISVLENI